MTKEGKTISNSSQQFYIDPPLSNLSTAAFTLPFVLTNACKFAALSEKPISCNCCNWFAYLILGSGRGVVAAVAIGEELIGCNVLLNKESKLSPFIVLLLLAVEGGEGKNIGGKAAAA